LITVGRLIPSKRFEFAIDLLARMQSTYKIDLKVVGDGPERSRLEARARDLPVTFLGHISDREALANLLRVSDVLLMPSASEGQPNAILEALACGVPVVATDIPGHHGLVGPGVFLAGLDLDQWISQVDRALALRSLPEADVEDRLLSHDEVALRHLAVFEAAISRRQLQARTLGARQAIPRSGVGS
jgi:glycosyltransferase involved in cell wall biosynthesis